MLVVYSSRTEAISRQAQQAYVALYPNTIFAPVCIHFLFRLRQKVAIQGFHCIFACRSFLTSNISTTLASFASEACARRVGATDATRVSSRMTSVIICTLSKLVERFDFLAYVAFVASCNIYAFLTTALEASSVNAGSDDDTQVIIEKSLVW